MPTESAPHTVPLEVVAHRGWSGTEPEQTRAAYTTAIARAAAAGRPLTLECDVHFSADGELICLHDLTLQRTAGRPEQLVDLPLAQLREIDFGSWKVTDPTPDQAAVMALTDLFDLTAAARARGEQISLAVETKHPNPRGGAVEEALARLLTDYGWYHPDSPVRMISFAPEAVAAIGPRLKRSLLLAELGPYASGELPPGVDTAGIWLKTLRADPDFVARAAAHGNQVHVWTVNEPADIEFCLAAGVTAITSDHPDRVWSAIAG
ncbi:glycerophosphodiester phosphodiesterase [Granulicoccus phenolivorans]|uniref:glycerophosphodiester phosphodiesterase n=1 Tax=Granulicoccus phenolivorans TaxID=266854 RepID=UPI0003F4E542|nr:glycerophosphodiester phosphodiesterase family protein [Granulicoccus phenolivorans]